MRVINEEMIRRRRVRREKVMGYIEEERSERGR